MFTYGAIKEQVSFCCDDWTAFIAEYSCDFCTLTWIHVVENKVPQITTWRDFLLGITKHGGIPEFFFPCILNASDGAKCGILFSPGVAKGLAKTHCPSQLDLTTHTGVYLTLTVGRTTKKRLTLTMENDVIWLHVLQPFWFRLHTDRPVSSGHESHKNKKSKENMGNICFSCPGFITELSSNPRLVQSSNRI